MKTLSRTVLTLFVLSFSCLAAIAGEVSFKITKQYLNFPISHKENRGRMTFEVNGKPDLSVVIRLAPDEAEYWVFKDVSAFKGKTIKITYDGNEKGLSKIYQSDEIEGQAELVEFLAFLAQYGVQIIVETHSDHIYNGIRRSICLDQIDSDKVKVYSFKRDEKGCTVPVNIPINENGKALKNPEGFFDQINKDLDVILGW